MVRTPSPSCSEYDSDDWHTQEEEEIVDVEEPKEASCVESEVINLKKDSLTESHENGKENP